MNKESIKSAEIERLTKLAVQTVERPLRRLLSLYINVNDDLQVEYLNHDGSVLTTDRNLFIESKLKRSSMFTGLIKAQCNGR